MRKFMSKRNWDDLVNKSYTVSSGSVLTVKELDKSNVNRIELIFECDICSRDEYVQEGLCSGIFEVPKSDITKGSLACRCSAHPMWTEKQYIYKINKMGIGHFNQWVSEFKDRTSHFKWTCNHGHSNKSSIYNFLNNESGCTTCCRRGFKKDIPAILYVVRWYGFGESFLKFGITNRDVFERINEQRSRGMLDYELVKVYYSDLGEIVDNCERELKKMMNTHQCPKRWLPDGFTETVEDTEDNLKSIHDTTILFNLKESTND